MNVPSHRRILPCLLAAIATTVVLSTARADEIRLKDGKKLYGVIVAYEDNMFKVKTDFGYVLVEKDKIESIIPDTPAGGTAAKTNPAPSAKSKAKTKPSATPTPAPANDATASATGADEKSSAQPEQAKRDKTAAVVSNANARPEIPPVTPVSAGTSAPALKTAPAIAKAPIPSATAPPPPPKEEPAPIREEIQGNLYINHEFGFRMYKAPSWQLIDGAGQTLPNAIVAMGTSNESTLLVIGHEKTKAALETAAQGIEKRLQDVYENYRVISQRKSVVAGQPAMEYHYRGVADGHDWSGTLVVLARNGDLFTILGMTFADNDLIQIQENVITRSIASVNFSAN